MRVARAGFVSPPGVANAAVITSNIDWKVSLATRGKLWEKIKRTLILEAHRNTMKRPFQFPGGRKLLVELNGLLQRLIEQD